MVIRVTENRLTIEASDPVIVERGRAALQALGDEGDLPDAIRGDLPVSASLSTVWQALYESLGVIQRRATLPSQSPSPGGPGSAGQPGQPGQPGTEAA